MEKVIVIKKEAMVPITLGTGMIQRLQKIFAFIVTNVSPEDIELYKELVGNNKPVTEEWMEHLTTISMLLVSLEEQAIKTGQTYEEDPFIEE